MMTIVITDLYGDQTRHFLSSFNAFIFYFNTAMDCFIVILLISKLIL